MSTPTLTLTSGTRGQIGYTITNNDDHARTYYIEGVPYNSFFITGATGIIAGNATLTGTLTVLDDFKETTTKPRFRARNCLLTKYSQDTEILVGETSFEPLEFHENSSTVAPIS